MIAIIIGTTILLVAVLIVFWFFSPSFRSWAEKPKYTMLERNQDYERADRDKSNTQPTDHRY